MRSIYFVLFFLGLFTFNARGQVTPQLINEWKHRLIIATSDSVRLNYAAQLSGGLRFSNVDSSLYYNNLALVIADRMKYLSAKAGLLSLKGATFLEAGKIPESLKLQYEALHLSENIMDSNGIARALNSIGNIYMELKDYTKANEYYFLSRDLAKQLNIQSLYYNELSNIGNVYELMGKPDSALKYQQLVYDASLKDPERKMIIRPEMMFRMGNVFRFNGEKDKALLFYKKGIEEAMFSNDLRNLTMNNLFIASLYDEMKMTDSGIVYAQTALTIAKKISFRKGTMPPFY